MVDKPKLERQVMCARLAMEFQDGWIVNLGAVSYTHLRAHET